MRWKEHSTRSHLIGAVPILLLDVGLPVVAYYLARLLGAGSWGALLAASGAALARVLYVAVRSRRFDGFAAFMVSVFGIGLALSLLRGDPRTLLLKDSVPTAVAGGVFLVSALVRRPMIFGVLRRTEGRTPEGRAELDHRWATVAAFRRTLTIMTVAWGVVLLAEALVRVPLIYALPVDVVTGLSSVMQLTCFVSLTVFTFAYRARAERRRAAAETPSPAVWVSG